MEKNYNILYIVKDGDTLDKIAEKYKISPIEILISNSIVPNMIKKGTVIYINH